MPETALEAAPAPIEVAPIEEAAACVACGSRLGGRYCAGCGEPAPDSHRLSLRHFVVDSFLHDFVHLDGKIWGTLRALLFHPGLLSHAYVAGPRRRYLTPVRLLLTALIVFALVAPRSILTTITLGEVHLSLMPPPPPLTSSIETTVQRLDLLGFPMRQFTAVRASKKLESAAAVARFNGSLKTYATAFSLGNVVLLAGLLFFLYRRRRRYFVEHLVFSTHLAAFVMLFAVLHMNLSRLLFALILPHRIELLPWLGRYGLVIIALQAVYLGAALFRFYYHAGARRILSWRHPLWRVIPAVALILLANSVFIGLVHAAGAWIALVRL